MTTKSLSRIVGMRTAAVAVWAAMLLSVAGCEGPQQQTRRQAKFHMEQAQVFTDQGLMDSALAAFGLAIESNPNILDAHMGMANIYKERGNYELASRSYERAATLAPNSFDAHFQWGLMEQLLGKLDSAVRIYLRALAIRPDSPKANENLASAYLQLGRPSEALTYAKRATELQAMSQSAWANLGATCTQLGKYDDAIDAYRRAAELGKAEEPILLGLADAHIKLEHWDRAAVVLERLVKEKPSATAHERLGFAQFKQRRFPQALASFRAALGLDPNDTSALNGLGVSLMTQYIQGDRANTTLRDEALASWRKSVQLRPDQPRIIDLISRYQRL